MIKALNIDNTLQSTLDNYISNYTKSYLALKQESNKTPTKFVLVEGYLDKDFYQKLLPSYTNNRLIVINDIINTYLALKSNLQKRYDNKVEILKIVIKTNFQYLNSNNIYGIVDRDFDEDYPTIRNDRVLSDTTHDLETMLISTEFNVLKTIFNFDENKFNTSMFMAYQIGTIKNCISKYISTSPPHSINNFIDMKMFFDNDKLNIKNFVNYINNNAKNTDNSNKKLKYNELIDRLKKQKIIDNNSETKIDYNKFKSNLPEDFYLIVNGHDLLNCFIYNYKDTFNKALKEVERNLINNYKLENFNKTNLYLKLKQFNII